MRRIDSTVVVLPTCRAPVMARTLEARSPEPSDLAQLLLSTGPPTKERMISGVVSRMGKSWIVLRQPRQLRLCGGWSHYWCDARAKAGELQSAESFTRSLRCRQPGNRRLKAPPGLDGRTGAETALLTRGASLGPVEERQAPIALVNRSLFAATNDQRSFDYGGHDWA